LAAIGLFFGSFNPVHIGHLLLATYIKEAAKFDEIWFIVSPQNPFKATTELANENDRYKMVQLAIKNTNYFKASDIEFNLPKPSYTHHTIKQLKQQFPTHQFSLIIGSDNINKFDEWKEADWIKKNIEIVVYNRTTTQSNPISDFKVYTLPLLDISSTEIRQRIRNKQAIQYFITEDVEHFIKFHKLYL
jgi:nicotinate-nucleotide adenylyltransferase